MKNAFISTCCNSLARLLLHCSPDLRPPGPGRQDGAALHLALQGIQPLCQPAQGVQGKGRSTALCCAVLHCAVPPPSGQRLLRHEVLHGEAAGVATADIFPHPAAPRPSRFCRASSGRKVRQMGLASEAPDHSEADMGDWLAPAHWAAGMGAWLRRPSRAQRHARAPSQHRRCDCSVPRAYVHPN